MTKLEVIKFLIDEIENEFKQNEIAREQLSYAKKQEEIVRQQNLDKGVRDYIGYYKFLPKDYREPKKSVIRSNVVMARRLLLELSKEIEI